MSLCVAYFNKLWTPCGGAAGQGAAWLVVGGRGKAGPSSGGPKLSSPSALKRQVWRAATAGYCVFLIRTTSFDSGPWASAGWPCADGRASPGASVRLRLVPLHADNFLAASILENQGRAVLCEAEPDVIDARLSGSLQAHDRLDFAARDSDACNSCICAST